MKVAVKLTRPEGVDSDVWSINHQLFLEALHKFIDNIWPGDNIDVDVDVKFTVNDVVNYYDVGVCRRIEEVMI